VLEAAVQGYLVAISLIAAIGAQNAFVLRQGIAARACAGGGATCALSDAVLIAAGVAGFGACARRCRGWRM
jgi:L-lysine exporter family protein LysE/ArgO